MTEDDLRALVRESIARHLAGSRPWPAPAEPMLLKRDPSHALFTLPAAAEGGACVIEPSVSCTHCGFCKSYGH